jgi:hypothetical protein
VIRTSGDSVIETALLKRTREGQVNMAEKWCKLRHLLGRWSSYRQAADVIITGAYRWPTLFQGFTIVSVPSSVRNDNPVPKSDLTAADIVRKMVGKDAVDKDVLVEEAEELQHKFDVDVTIQKHVRSKRFRPLVHAEVLVHDYLTKQGVDHSSQYWNSWNYIGTSKPACRLCQYYFQEHPNHVYVRQSHLNLYTNWRLPDAFNDDESNMVVELLRRIASRMHGDVKRTLRQKTARGKRQDSNTYSKIPPFVRPTYDIAKTVTSGIAELEVGGSIDNNADDSLSTTGNDDWSGVEGDEEQNV